VSEGAARPTRDPGRTRRRILRAARRVFARHGLDGARVDAIADDAGSNKRMIYYYFTDKDGLFLAVLESIYGELSEAAETLALDAPPLDALEAYVDFMWGYYLKNPEVVAILNNENLHGAPHLKQSPLALVAERPLVARLDALLAEGAAAGTFRNGLDAVEIHITVIALVYLFIGNNATLSLYFGRDLSGGAAQAAWRAHIQRAVRAIVSASAATD
jgi:AcrR family transcriptional regulator